MTASGSNDSPRRSSRLRTRVGWKMPYCWMASWPPAQVKISSRRCFGRLCGRRERLDLPRLGQAAAATVAQPQLRADVIRTQPVDVPAPEAPRPIAARARHRRAGHPQARRILKRPRERRLDQQPVVRRRRQQVLQRAGVEAPAGTGGAAAAASIHQPPSTEAAAAPAPWRRNSRLVGMPHSSSGHRTPRRTVPGRMRCGWSPTWMRATSLAVLNEMTDTRSSPATETKQ